jgi:predicted RNase H-like nuclease (RuvC/YqgF family)
MLKVQFELIQFQKKSQEFYFTVKKSERIQNLEKTIEWLRTESMILSKKNEALTQGNKGLKEKYTLADEESKFWKEQAFLGKNQIAILKKTVQTLKSPALLHKYEELGRQKAEHSFKKVTRDLK